MIEHLGLMPWEADRVTPKEARLLLSGANKRLMVITDAIESAAVQIVGVQLKDGGRNLIDALNNRRAQRDKK